MFIIQINKLRLRVFNFTKVILLQPGIEPRGNSFLMCSPLNLEKGSYSFSFLISTHFSNCSFCFLCQPLILYLSFNRGSVLRLSPLTLCSFFFRESHSLQWLQLTPVYQNLHIYMFNSFHFSKLLFHILVSHLKHFSTSQRHFKFTS